MARAAEPPLSHHYASDRLGAGGGRDQRGRAVGETGADHVAFENGRHRTAWARDHGVTALPVMVHQKSDADVIPAELGIEERASRGAWHWKEGLVQDRNKWFSKFQEVRALWSKNVALFNARIAPRNMGRPLQASNAQQQRVVAKRAAGQSLRSIAEETELSLQTVRTIIDKKDGIDRATIARLQRIAPDRVAEAQTRRSSKEIAALPKRINANLERNAELLKQAKGLK